MNINGGHHKKLHKAHKSPLISAISFDMFFFRRHDPTSQVESTYKRKKKSIKSNLPKTVKIEFGRLRANFLKRRKRPEAILIQLSDERQKRNTGQIYRLCNNNL